jgi:hypothetical protein
MITCIQSTHAALAKFAAQEAFLPNKIYYWRVTRIAKLRSSFEDQVTQGENPASMTTSTLLSSVTSIIEEHHGGAEIQHSSNPFRP